jgi:hypothetical protein
MNWIRSRMRLDPSDLTRRDLFQLAHSALQKTLLGSVTLPVRALAKNSSPKQNTSRVMIRNGLANRNSNRNSPRSNSVLCSACRAKTRSLVTMALQSGTRPEPNPKRDPRDNSLSTTPLA